MWPLQLRARARLLPVRRLDGRRLSDAHNLAGSVKAIHHLLHFGGSAAGFLASAPPAPPAPFAFDLNAFVASLTPHPGLVPPAPREPPSEPTEPTPEAQELGRRIQEAFEAEEAAAAAEGEGEGDASDDDESADEDPGSDGEEAEGAGLAASLQELLSLINDEADDSEATMAEMRFYLHSRLGPQALLLDPGQLSL